jgi:hypothetical protein
VEEQVDGKGAEVEEGGYQAPVLYGGRDVLGVSNFLRKHSLGCAPE